MPKTAKRPKNGVIRKFLQGSLRDPRGRIVRSRRIANRMAKKK